MGDVWCLHLNVCPPNPREHTGSLGVHPYILVLQTIEIELTSFLATLKLEKMARPDRY